MYLDTLLQFGRFDPLDGVVVFAVGLLVGGGAIHVAARHVVFRGEPGGLTFEHAVLTALLGAVAWALLSWIPLFGALFGLVGWIGVIKWRYPGGWAKAAVTGAAAWAAAVVALAALELIGLGSVSALGVPGT
ncbi:hypothetical protein [Halobellus limi]|jgi:hypothetical protein|uniref:Uncharacterized protein n=1 Tax=Halobellus limi TaxID=699433 RepID=A0A1H5TZB5_9EURY|nr:hypothetical protein [Halobellus limi]QCC47188.1 hypothetical protein DV707_05590 [Halobellus limi]SEF68202.1 hypothetical protein SAMN04488133_0433 [Halobellus limi]